MYMAMYMSICVCVHINMCIYMCDVYMYIYMCVYVLCLCIYVYMYMFITSAFVYVYLCIWMYIFRHCVCKRAYILFWSYDHVHIEKEKNIQKISYSNKALMIFHRDASNSLVLGINCLGADLPSLTVLPWDSRFWLKSHSLTVRHKIFTANWYLRKVFPQYSFTDFFTILQTKVVIRIDL